MKKYQKKAHMALIAEPQTVMGWSLMKNVLFSLQNDDDEKSVEEETDDFLPWENHSSL